MELSELNVIPVRSSHAFSKCKQLKKKGIIKSFLISNSYIKKIMHSPSSHKEENLIKLIIRYCLFYLRMLVQKGEMRAERNHYETKNLKEPECILKETIENKFTMK